ncbi:sulfatase family protein [Seonamhaeicola maritimus]|uniref:sulfatase family protein n=1 Tax=Seonamhaeicola maritimus TaxID=2591822 RepID=UPI0024943B08|nr:arylsulfatase [Seonamhaeicola maritimus]
MKYLLKTLLAVCLCSCVYSNAQKNNKSSESVSSKPNIVIIYVDDMGFGDLNIQNPHSKIATPNLDELASQGMRFSDAHSSSGICTPSRFALLTGQYHWRRGHGIVGGFGNPYFKDSDITLPQILKDYGYNTAAIGKWHLGWEWDIKNPPSIEEEHWGKKMKAYSHRDINWETPIKGGPLQRGFNYYFGDGTINFPPYCWIENDLPIKAPNTHLDLGDLQTAEGHWEFRPGPMVKGWDPYEVLPTLSKKAQEWIGKQKKEEPFFLYFALPSPHAPIIPNKEFVGKSQAGGFGDFVFQTDYVVGEVLKSLKENGLSENTIIIFTADNGPERYAIERAENFGHFSSGDFKGVKRDVWEGGHHVPFIVSWPNVVEPGSVSNEVISQVDIMATLAQICNIELSEQAAPDSYNFLPVLVQENYKSPLREATVHNTYKDKWGLRMGDWLYINHSSGAGKQDLPDSYNALRGYKKFNTEGLLFNMKNDWGQRINLFEQYPEKVKEMKGLLQKYKNQDFSVKRE